MESYNLVIEKSKETTPFEGFGYTYVMNNPLIFTDPSGYMPQWVQDEYDEYYRNGGGGGGGGGFNYFGWINNSMNIGGWTKNSDDYWHYSPVSGTYNNSETGESINPITDYQGYKELVEPFFYDNSEENVEWSIQLYVGQGTWKSSTSLIVDPYGKVRVYHVLNSSAISAILGIGNSKTEWRTWQNTTLQTSGYAVGGFGLLNKGREVAEWEYLRQAKYNRALSGNYSQSIKHSVRAIRGVGSTLAIASASISAADILYNGPTVSNSLDLAMAGVGAIPGVGWGISAGYFLINTGLDIFTGRDIGDRIQNIWEVPNGMYFFQY